MTRHNAMKIAERILRMLQKPTTAKADARENLRRLIASGIDAKKIVIDPEMSAAMLERNADDEWSNRPQSVSGLKRYTRSMQRGWTYTGETIVFSSSGRLLQGQHRLTACLHSGCSFECLVAFGVSDDAFKFMDIGIKRTAGHIFAIEGIPNYNLAAASIRIVHGYLSRANWNGQIDKAVENDELLEFYFQHEGLQHSIHVGQAMTREGLLTPRWGAALHYICALKSRAAADSFFDKVVTGLSLDEKADPIYLIRKRLQQNARATKHDELADTYLGAYVIQAWNAHRRGEKRSIFRWRGEQSPHEAFPRAV